MTREELGSDQISGPLKIIPATTALFAMPPHQNPRKRARPDGLLDDMPRNASTRRTTRQSTLRPSNSQGVDDPARQLLATSGDRARGHATRQSTMGPPSGLNGTSTHRTTRLSTLRPSSSQEVGDTSTRQIPQVLIPSRQLASPAIRRSDWMGDVPTGHALFSKTASNPALPQTTRQSRLRPSGRLDIDDPPTRQLLSTIRPPGSLSPGQSAHHLDPPRAGEYLTDQEGDSEEEEEGLSAAERLRAQCVLVECDKIRARL